MNSRQSGPKKLNAERKGHTHRGLWKENKAIEILDFSAASAPPWRPLCLLCGTLCISFFKYESMKVGGRKVSYIYAKQTSKTKRLTAIHFQTRQHQLFSGVESLNR